MAEIGWQDFEKVELCVGTMVAGEPFPEARKPAEGIEEPAHG